jgi:hypothetical protein
VDYVCPFWYVAARIWTTHSHSNHCPSAKMATTIERALKPLISQRQYDGKIKIIIRPHVQPWHASSTYTHEAALAVRNTCSLCHRSYRTLDAGCPCLPGEFLAIQSSRESSSHRHFQKVTSSVHPSSSKSKTTFLISLFRRSPHSKSVKNWRPLRLR